MGRLVCRGVVFCPPLVKWAKWAHPIEKSWELLVWNPSGESWETCDYVCARHHCGDKEWGKFPPRLSGGACNVLYMHQKCHSSSTTRVANCESGANKCRHCTLALKLEHPEPQLTPPSISSLTFTCPRNKPLMSRTMFLIFLGGTYLEKGKSLSAMFSSTSTNHNQGES